MEKKRSDNLTQEESEKLRLATDYLHTQVSIYKFDFIYMYETSQEWNFYFQYQPKYDKKKEKYITIFINKISGVKGIVKE